jgi:hypothetical protein
VPDVRCVGGDGQGGCLRVALVSARVGPAMEPVGCWWAVYARWNRLLWYFENVPMTRTSGRGGIIPSYDLNVSVRSLRTLDRRPMVVGKQNTLGLTEKGTIRQWES